MNNDSIWVKLAYLDKILGTLAFNELKAIFGKKRNYHVSQMATWESYG
jgi:hypothetical protein